MKPLSKVAAVLFGIFCLVQATRFLQGWPVTVNGVTIPVWPSAVASVVAGVLAVGVWRESR